MKAQDFRKELHKIPELGKMEYETKNYILKILKPYHLKIFEPTPTAIVVYFDVQKEKTICFRADMDGLAIFEKTNLPFQSVHPNRMHACGHDGHMAMLLEYILWAKDHKEELACNIVCLFQPSEEEHAGALDILKSSILDTLKVEEIYGMHIWPNLKKNLLYTYDGAMLASSSEVTIEFYGKASHAANRESGIDALCIASQFVLDCYKAFDQIQEQHLFSVGTFHSGNARNIVSDYTILEATMRNFTDDVFLKMKKLLYDLKEEYERNMGIQIQITIHDFYKSVMNDSNLISRYTHLIPLHILDAPYMQAEDFGCYTRKYKSMFMLLGTGDKQILHTDTFDFDMDILATGVEAYKTISKKN